MSTPVPTWTIHAKNEIMYQSPAMLKHKFTNILNSTILDFGTHYLAFEQPEVFSESVLTALTAFRKWHRNNNENKVCNDELSPSSCRF